MAQTVIFLKCCWPNKIRQKNLPLLWTNNLRLVELHVYKRKLQEIKKLNSSQCRTNTVHYTTTKATNKNNLTSGEETFCSSFCWSCSVPWTFSSGWTGAKETRTKQAENGAWFPNLMTNIQNFFPIHKQLAQ